MHSVFSVVSVLALRVGYVLLLLAALTACSNKPNVVKPTELASFDSSFSVQRVWHRHAGFGSMRAALELRPAVTESAVFVVDLNGRLQALNPRNGRLLWRRETGQRISSPVTASDGLLLLGTRDGEALALSMEDGAERWRTQLSGEVLSAPATDGDVAIFQSQDGRVVALNLADGTEYWSFEVTVPPLTLRGTSAPLIDGRKVFAGFASGRVVALELSSGVPLWERRVAEPTGRSELDRLVDIDANLILDNGGLFVSSFQGKLAVLDEDSGRIYWDRDMSTANRVASAVGLMYLADDDGVVWAIDQRSGNPVWQQEGLRARQLTGVALHEGQVVVGDRAGYLHWLDPDSGAFVARRRHDPDGFAATPIVSGETLYAVSGDGEITAYRLKARRR
ncbi:MAG: outer membrane protein assembly factor BamB [Gammaproteobacteria bacterium HGW-Gammaproteobacteria-14]|nr:MAG: outer membrane protein assembly factor BamB [Gammaproteobacteria bacterium HGW-Gammaproteobacteria-14]